MKQGIRRGLASLGLLLAVSSCADLPVAPSKNSSGEPVTKAPAAAAPPVARIVLAPDAVEINAPYALGGYQSETEAEPSQHEVAGFPTTAQLFVSFLAESGEATKPAPLIWKSSDTGLVVVDAQGWIRAVDPGVAGTATVTAHLAGDSEIKASTTVTVRNDGKLVVELN